MKSKETGFVHTGDRIPLVDNFCHILELLQTKTSENMHEAKFMLSRLFHFQSASGNFPQYLHEYPDCYNGLVAFELLEPLYLMQRDFGSILKSTGLDGVIEKVQSFCTQNLDRGFVKPWHRVLYKAALGLPIEQSEWQAHTSSGWAVLLKAHGLVGGCLDQLEAMWHPDQIFMGLDEPYKRGVPSPLSVPEIEGKAPSCVFRRDHVPGTYPKTYHIFRMVGPAGDLVCQQTQYQVSFGDAIEFTYLEQAVEDELNFYVSRSDQSFDSSVFYLGDTVSVSGFTLRFELVEGEGTFVGHISRANRPSEVKSREDRFAMYDFRIALRTVQRDGPVKIRVYAAKACNSLLESLSSRSSFTVPSSSSSTPNIKSSA